MEKPSPFVRITRQARTDARNSTWSQSRLWHAEKARRAGSAGEARAEGATRGCQSRLALTFRNQLMGTELRLPLEHSTAQRFKARLEKDTLTLWKEIEPQNMLVTVSWTHTFYTPNNMLLSAINPNSTLEIYLEDQNIYCGYSMEGCFYHEIYSIASCWCQLFPERPNILMQFIYMAENETSCITFSMPFFD